MKRTKRFERETLKRGIYLLPNIFTSLNLFCGFFAIVAAVDGKFVAAAFAIVIAGLFDNLDGKIARATNTTSQFGVEYDSLADLISFGLAPGMMVYLWALRPMGRMGWLAGFLFMACGALRLARFNTQVGTVSSDKFIGLPIPAAAGMSATTVLFCYKVGWGQTVNPFVILVLLYCLSFLMVSTIRYNSFKRPELFKTMGFNSLVVALLVLIFIAAQPQIALFSFGLLYVLSGPVSSLRRMLRLKNAAEETSEEENHGSDLI
jgi:CDP-diacylglycerol--serine O-phosphatidyltransferase